MRANEIQVTFGRRVLRAIRFNSYPDESAFDTHRYSKETKTTTTRRPKFTPSKGDSSVSWGENGSKLSDSIERHFRNGGRANSSLNWGMQINSILIITVTSADSL